MPAKRSAVQPGERNVTEGPLSTDHLEQYYDEDGVLHDPMAGQGKAAFRNTRATSEIRGPDDSFFDTTGVTREQGLPQPGPALDALHAAGAIDDEAFEERKREIEEPRPLFLEEQAAAQEAATKVRREAEARIIGHEPTGEVRTEAGEAGTSRANMGPDADKPRSRSAKADDKKE